MQEKESKDYLQHANDFMQYVADNERDLQNAIKKNITYDDELFHDVTANTTLRIAEYIINNKANIKSFKNFYFICAKRDYITEQTKKRKAMERDNRTFFDNIFNGLEKKEKAEDVIIFNKMINDNDAEIKEKRKKSIHDLFIKVEEWLKDRYPAIEVDIFMLYYRLKSSRHGISYQKLADLIGVETKNIAQIIQKLKTAISNSEELQQLKKEMLKNDD